MLPAFETPLAAPKCVENKRLLKLLSNFEKYPIVPSPVIVFASVPIVGTGLFACVKPTINTSSFASTFTSRAFSWPVPPK